MTKKIRLSIIIPVYNAGTYFTDLMGRLERQLTDSVEVIVVDDGSDVPVEVPDWAQLVRQPNGGVSSARNRGLDLACGEYVAFIDADDLVSGKYIDTILDKIDSEHPDYIYLSWKTIGDGWKQDIRLTNVSDTFPRFNLCVWNRIYKRSMIGDVRFNEAKKIAEDAEFIRMVNEDGFEKAIISDYMYFYRSDSADSLTKRFARGEVDTKRIVYHIPTVTPDMAYLIDEFKEADKDAEVILMTQNNQIPELAKYAMVLLPCHIKGTELRGEPTWLFTKIEPPIKTQVVIYTAVTFNIGGIETFIYNFCSRMRCYYDIVVLYDVIDPHQLGRLRKIVQCEKNTGRKINCDTIIINRITDKIPNNVSYKKSIQMVHACKMIDKWTVPKDRSEIVCVSKAVKDSFGLDNATVIPNLASGIIRPAKPLLLVTASRLSTFEKGEQRMINLAKALIRCGIQFVWLIFSDVAPKELVPGMVHIKPRLDISGFISKADYLVQLSDAEGFCYSILEALNLGTAVISTPVPVLAELGFHNKEHGYTVPFDISPDSDVSFVEAVPQFKYSYDDLGSLCAWSSLLGDTIPTHAYKPPQMTVVAIDRAYRDTELDRMVQQGEVIEVTTEHANKVIGLGFGRKQNEG